MRTVLEVVAPVFLLIGAGYFSALRNVLNADQFRGLGWFTFSLAAPALLFAGGTAGHGGGGGAALAFFLGSGVLYVAALWGAKRRMSLSNAGTFALNVSFGNSVMMGIPLIAAAYGQAGLAVMLTILALHSMVMLGTATVVAEIGQNAGAAWPKVLRATVAGVVRNPIVMAVLAALIWSQTGVPLPGFFRRTLELLGQAAPPVALFCLGGSLLGFSVRGAVPELATTVLLKLLAQPALVWLACLWLDLGSLETAVAVTAAAMPTGANAFLMAQRYAVGQDRSGAAVLVGTALSVLTLGALVGWFRG
ncbi:AEC family transporter [Humitalea sp. 24SJ18S-53]|uniref:AEC family transporter n=1 Tax=Humitalea sp. 24SJ18S-53 TaxID=3422307 RepID=UPI003D672CFA